uniref:Endoplasmic reticulum transmembrane protein n=1 Tax=Arundo donax TaxID=35708 RepID=A0A0A9GH76_ARUDO
MALQWMILTWVAAAEAVVAALLTLPAPRAVRYQIVALTSLLLQPFASVLPFAGFNLLDIYWKKEHRLMCTSEVCTADERIRFEKSIFKAQRNVILCVLACLLYWIIYRIVKYNKDIKALGEAEKRLKEE